MTPATPNRLDGRSGLTERTGPVGRGVRLLLEDGTFSGGWRPNPGADDAVNVPYDIGGHRLE